MTSLIRWDPIAELESFTQDPFFRRFLRQHGDASDTTGWLPAMDLVEEEDALLALFEVPGVDPRSIQLTVIGDHLTLRGTREVNPNGDDRTRPRRERTSGNFERTVRLPYRIEPDKAKANYRHGVLTVRMPKTSEQLGRRVSVEIG